MNATTTDTPTYARPAAPGAVQRLLHALSARLRRGLELAGAAYVDGHTPPV
nr:hypothetical protein [uncultured Massilia sp.]